jgi:mycothiol synthase
VIKVRELRDDEVDVYLDVRNRVNPDTPIQRDVFVDDRQRAGHLDLLAELDGAPVGVSSVGIYGGAPDSDAAFVTLKVLPEHRRLGVGTALHYDASEHAREALGKSRFFCVVRHDDADSLAYYTAHGYEEVGRMQDAFLELATAHVEPTVPDGIEIVPLAAERDRATYEVALEADADIPTGEPHTSGSFEHWYERNLGAFVNRDLSFVALEHGQVVAYAILQRLDDDTAEHAMTGVARAARGRGIASALKQAQVAAAKQAGLSFLRTQNDLGNAPMRRINDKLGYVPRFEWVHLTGPLLKR